MIFQSLGTPSNSAIQKYMNAKKVPQLFVATGATKWGDPKNFPWTMGWQPNYQSEARIYAKYLLEKYPNAKIGILYQNDDYGKDYVKGLKDGLGAKAKTMIVAEQPYETYRPDGRFPDRQSEGFRRRRILQRDDAEVRRAGDPQGGRDRLEAAAPAQQRLQFGRLGAQAGRAGECQGRHLDGLLQGPDRSDLERRRWLQATGATSWTKYFPEGDKTSSFTVYGYTVAQTLVQVLKQCGDNLTRENVMKQAANLKDVELEMLLPGIKINTSADRLLPDRADADDALQRRALGTVRPGAERRHQQLRQGTYPARMFRAGQARAVTAGRLSAPRDCNFCTGFASWPSTASLLSANFPNATVGNNPAYRLI